VRVHPDWAPLGAARFKELVEQGFYNDIGVFRVVNNFVAQFGLPAKPQPELQRIADDNVTHPNVRGTITFATSGPNSRTSQLFINYGDNHFLNSRGFAPFGEVMEDGMNVVDRFYMGYGEKPSQQRVKAKGNAYLDGAFPQMTKIIKVFVKPAGEPAAPQAKAEAPAKREAPAKKQEAPAKKEEAPAKKEAQCLPVAEGTECYKLVTWTREHGVKEHPAWYPGLTASSSREGFQAFLHGKKPDVCPKPCAAAGKEAAAGGAVGSAPHRWKDEEVITR
jgi:cyclophilin family peptidyl-prolyl cis-trans isomerase